MSRSHISRPNWTAFAALPAAILAASLTGCSTPSDGASSPELQVKPVVSNDAKTAPELPPHIVKCLNKQPEPADNADAMVLNQLAADEERRACSLALLKWYRGLQAAQAKQAKR